MDSLSTIGVDRTDIQHATPALFPKVRQRGLNQKKWRLQVDGDGSVECFCIGFFDAATGDDSRIVYQAIDSSKVSDCFAR